MPLDARAVAPSEQAAATVPVTPPPAKIDVKGMNFYYGANRVLENINVKFDRPGGEKLQVGKVDNFQVKNVVVNGKPFTVPGARP